MSKRVKELCKKVIYPAWDILGACIPPVSRWLIHRFYKFRALNDLRIYKNAEYTHLGTYVTFYERPPAFYHKLLKTYHYDDRGIPQFVYEGRLLYNVVQISQFGLMEYGYYLSTKDPVHRENCIKSAQKLLEWQDERGGWPYEMDYPCPEVGDTLRSGWYSAMGQGQAISLLVRADSLQHDIRYQQAAYRAIELMKIPVEEGGLHRTFNGYSFLEEYPTKTPSYTLNGLIFCMIGLYDGYQAFQIEEAGVLFETLCKTLHYILPLYDDRYISSYDLSHLTNAPRRKLQNRKYHILHVKLLQAITSIKNDNVYQFYIEKWRKTI